MKVCFQLIEQTIILVDRLTAKHQDQRINLSLTTSSFKRERDKDHETLEPTASANGFNDYYRADDCTIKQHIAVPGTPRR